MRATVSTESKKTISKLKSLGFVDPSKGKDSTRGSTGKVVTLVRVVSMADDNLKLIQEELGPAVTFSNS